MQTIVSVYRLFVMTDRIDSLTEPGNALNKPSAKAAFYVLHIVPEWIAAVILLGYNTRQVFGTGPWGDWRRKDETEEQRRKRIAKEARKGQGLSEHEPVGAYNNEGEDERVYMLSELRTGNTSAPPNGSSTKPMSLVGHFHR